LLAANTKPGAENRDWDSDNDDIQQGGGGSGGGGDTRRDEEVGRL